MIAVTRAFLDQEYVLLIAASVLSRDTAQLRGALRELLATDLLDSLAWVAGLSRCVVVSLEEDQEFLAIYYNQLVTKHREGGRDITRGDSELELHAEQQLLAFTEFMMQNGRLHFWREVGVSHFLGPCSPSTANYGSQYCAWELARASWSAAWLTTRAEPALKDLTLTDFFAMPP